MVTDAATETWPGSGGGDVVLARKGAIIAFWSSVASLLLPLALGLALRVADLFDLGAVDDETFRAGFAGLLGVARLGSHGCGY